MVALFGIVAIAYLINRRPDISVEKSQEFETCVSTYKTNMTGKLNHSSMKFTVAGLDIDRFNYEVYVSDEMILMVEADLLKSLLSCSVLEYNDGGVIIMKGDNKVVRGGAWNYRPKHSAAYVRNSYFAWQPANNVGFRVIIEE